MQKLIPVIVALLLVSGCEGEQGPVGPSGADGNANVRTGTISPTNAEWLWRGSYAFQTTPNSWTSYHTRYVEIPVTELTPEFISTGHVLVFFEATPGSGEWTPLPFQFLDSSRTFNYNIVYEVTAGIIRLHFFHTINDAGGSFPELENKLIPTYTFKYMVIEGSVFEAMAAREVDVSDLDEVTEYLASP